MTKLEVLKEISESCCNEDLCSYCPFDNEGTCRFDTAFKRIQSANDILKQIEAAKATIKLDGLCGGGYQICNDCHLTIDECDDLASRNDRVELCIDFLKKYDAYEETKEGGDKADERQEKRLTMPMSMDHEARYTEVREEIEKLIKRRKPITKELAGEHDLFVSLFNSKHSVSAEC